MAEWGMSLRKLGLWCVWNDDCVNQNVFSAVIVHNGLHFNPLEFIEVTVIPLKTLSDLGQKSQNAVYTSTLIVCHISLPFSFSLSFLSCYLYLSLIPYSLSLSLSLSLSSSLFLSLSFSLARVNCNKISWSDKFLLQILMFFHVSWLVKLRSCSKRQISTCFGYPPAASASGAAPLLSLILVKLRVKGWDRVKTTK